MKTSLERYGEHIQQGSIAMTLLQSGLKPVVLETNRGFNLALTEHGFAVNFYNLSVELTLKVLNLNHFELLFSGHGSSYQPIVNLKDGVTTLTDGASGEAFDFEKLFRTVTAVLEDQIDESALTTQFLNFDLEERSDI